MDIGDDGKNMAHRDVEFKAVKLLLRTRGCAAKVRVQSWRRIAQQDPPKWCIVIDSAVACLGSTTQGMQSRRIKRIHA